MRLEDFGSLLDFYVFCKLAKRVGLKREHIHRKKVRTSKKQINKDGKETYISEKRFPRFEPWTNENCRHLLIREVVILSLNLFLIGDNSRFLSLSLKPTQEEKVSRLEPWTDENCRHLLIREVDVLSLNVFLIGDHSRFLSLS